MVNCICKSFHLFRPTVDEILKNPEIEAVAVETEEIYLTKYALMVAEAGKHLHIGWKYDRAYDRSIDNSKILKATSLTCADFKSIKEGIYIELKKLGAI